MGNINTRINSVSDIERGITSGTESRNSEYPFFRAISLENQKQTVEEKELITAFRSFNHEEFKTALKRIRSKRKDKDVHEDNMKQILLETLLVSPLEEDIAQEIQDLLQFSDEKSTKILLDILLKLGFYSNLQKVMLINYEKDKQTGNITRIPLAEEHLNKILKSTDLRTVDPAKLFELHDINVKDNLIKYLLDFDKLPIDNFQRQKSKLEETSTFTQVLVPIMTESEKDFKPFFTKHIRRLRRDLNIDENKSIFTADCNVLLQLALEKTLKKIVSTIIQNTNINVNGLMIIKDEQPKRFTFYVAEKGYPVLLNQILERNDCEVFMQDSNQKKVSLFSECVRGYCINKSSIYNPNLDKYTVDFKKCIQLIMSEKRFEDVATEHYPMIDSVKYNFEFASFALIEKFGLTGNLIEQSSVDVLNSFLNSRVIDNDKEFRVNYNFLQNAKSDDDTPNTANKRLNLLANNNELRDLVQHPVLSTYIELKSRRFEVLHQISLILFITFFVIPVVTAHFIISSDRVMATALLSVPILYLLLREFLNVFFYQKSVEYLNDSSNSKYFKSFSNIVGVLLLIFIIATYILLLLNFIEVFKIVYSLTIFLMSLETMMLLTAAFPTLRIFLYILKTIVFTYGRILIIFLLFIFTFTFTFYVIFFNTVMSERLTDMDMQTADDTVVESPNTFSHLWNSFVKTHIMLVGNYNSEANYSVLNGWWWIFFVLCAIVLLNFMNGLAVFDVQKIRSNADVHNIIIQLEYLDKFELLVDNFMRNEPESSLKSVLQSAVKNIVPEPYEIKSIIVTENETFYENHSESGIIRTALSDSSRYKKFKNINKIVLINDQNVRDRKFDEIAGNLFEVKEWNSIINKKIDALKVDVSNIKVSTAPEVLDRSGEIESINNILQEMQDVKEKLNQIQNLFIHTNRRNTAVYGSKSNLKPPGTTKK